MGAVARSAAWYEMQEKNTVPQKNQEKCKTKIKAEQVPGNTRYHLCLLIPCASNRLESQAHTQLLVAALPCGAASFKFLEHGTVLYAACLQRGVPNFDQFRC